MSCACCDSQKEVVKVTVYTYAGVPLCKKCRQQCVDNGVIPHLTYIETYATKSQLTS